MSVKSSGVKCDSESSDSESSDSTDLEEVSRVKLYMRSIIFSIS